MDFSFCRAGTDVETLAQFFCDNLTPEYISHAELMGTRARDAKTWNSNIVEVIRQDFADRLDQPLDPAPGMQTMLGATLHHEGKLVGAFMITFSRVSTVPHCVLEDIVIDASVRGKRLGTHYMTWVEGECAKRGIKRVFLESGFHNHDAHSFFERHGFEKTSFVMMKEMP